jgi:hypothetical protein
MPYSLVRTRDGAGDSGPYSEALKRSEDPLKRIEGGGVRPRVGYAMRVGSLMARTYQMQDYWTTTYVTEITKDTEDEVHFRTGNSEYVWRKF